MHFYAEKTDGTENPRGGKFSCLISGGERRSEGFRAFLRRFLRTHGEEINILKNPQRGLLFPCSALPLLFAYCFPFFFREKLLMQLQE